MVQEEEATGRVRDIYEEIKNTFGIDFVPNLYKVMAPNSLYLEANWNKGQGGHVRRIGRP